MAWIASVTCGHIQTEDPAQLAVTRFTDQDLLEVTYHTHHQNSALPASWHPLTNPSQGCSANAESIDSSLCAYSRNSLLTACTAKSPAQAIAALASQLYSSQNRWTHAPPLPPSPSTTQACIAGLPVRHRIGQNRPTRPPRIGIVHRRSAQGGYIRPTLHEADVRRPCGLVGPIFTDAGGPAPSLNHSQIRALHCRHTATGVPACVSQTSNAMCRARMMHMLITNTPIHREQQHNWVINRPLQPNGIGACTKP